MIGRAGKPIAESVSFDLDTRPRDLEHGVWAGQVRMGEGFGTY